MSRRLFFLGFALLLAGFLASLGALSFQRKVSSFRPLGFELETPAAPAPAAGVPAAGALRVAAVDYPGARLEPGDQILLVQGQPVADRHALEELLRGRPQGKLLVGRGADLEPITYERPPLEVDFPFLILAAIGLLYLLIGLYTLFKDRHGSAGLFFFWCLTSAALFALSPSLAFRDGIDKLIFGVDQLARTLIPFLTIHLFLVFPTPLGRELRRFLPALYLAPAVLLGVHLSLFGRPVDRQVLLIAELERYLLVFGLLAALTLFVRLYLRGAWEQRRQVQWILFGVVGAAVPLLTLYLVPRSLGLAWPAWTTVVAVLPLGLIPLTFAWAIFKYQLLDLVVILRNTASYGLTVLVGLFGFVLFQLAIQSGLAERLQVSRTLLTFAAGLTIAGVLAPTRNAISSSLERLQYRASIGSRRMLSELGQELLHERDLDRLCAALSEHLADALVVRARLYLGQGGAMVPTEPDPELPRELAFDAFGAEFWDRDVTAISSIGLPSEEVPVEVKLFARGYRYALPLVVRKHRVGAVLMSYKYDEEPLNSEDLDIARGLLNQAALAIENAQLLEEVHRKLEEVTRLEVYSKGILENTPAGIAVFDSDLRVVSSNHAFATAIAGIARPDAVGRALEELLPIRPLPNAGEGLVEVSFCEASGQERYLQLSVAEYRREQGLQILIAQDVSERRAMEATLKEKERLASLGMLAAGVAHEVNTPLTGISSYAQILLQDVDESDPRYEILKKMERQTFRAAQIVNNLLDLARNRSGEMGPVELDAVIGECVQLLEDRARSAAVEIGWQPPSRPLAVSGHDGELHQVFNNLLVNAIDAMSTGGGRVEVTLEAFDHRVRVRVSDTGPGIPAERQESVFQPFFSSKLSQGGSGLGLAISQNIVRRHGGEIRAENNREAGGCTFTIELPRLGTIR